MCSPVIGSVGKRSSLALKCFLGSEADRREFSIRASGEAKPTHEPEDVGEASVSF
jgi:hypothetical protein